MVQDLADETDVFMEFGHLSNETRKKIEEFRRRKNAAEEYIDNSPIKPPKTRRTDGQETEEMRSDEKSLRGVEAKKVGFMNECINSNFRIRTRVTPWRGCARLKIDSASHSLEPDSRMSHRR